MYLNVFEYLCHIIVECIEHKEHGDSGYDVTYTLGIENYLSFLTLFFSYLCSDRLWSITWGLPRRVLCMKVHTDCQEEH